MGPTGPRTALLVGAGRGGSDSAPQVDFNGDGYICGKPVSQSRIQFRLERGCANPCAVTTTRS